MEKDKVQRKTKEEKRMISHSNHVNRRTPVHTNPKIKTEPIKTEAIPMGHNKKALSGSTNHSMHPKSQKQQTKSINQRTGNEIIEFSKRRVQFKEYKRRTTTDFANCNEIKERNMTNIWHSAPCRYWTKGVSEEWRKSNGKTRNSSFDRSCFPATFLARKEAFCTNIKLRASTDVDAIFVYINNRTSIAEDCMLAWIIRLQRKQNRSIEGNWKVLRHEILSKSR